MNYLEQLTYGKANRVVSEYSHLSGERAYDASMKALKDRYGDTDGDSHQTSLLLVWVFSKV
jgi:hypothetical protein